MPEKQERRDVKRIDCFAQTIANTEIEHSLVIDISDQGAGLLLLKNKSFFRDNAAENYPAIASDVHLTMFHPDISLHESISIDATVIWLDHDYSDNHRKIGVCFSDTDGAQSDYISKLTEWLSKESNYFLHCELTKL